MQEKKWISINRTKINKGWKGIPIVKIWKNIIRKATSQKINTLACLLVRKF